VIVQETGGILFEFTSIFISQYFIK